MAPTGLLLINLGTPEAPEAGPVRRYLREFLNDPRVIDIHPISRALLLNLIILPLRPAKSAAAYREIWTEAGSPLLVHGRALAEALAARMGQSWKVELAMRYGQPDIPSALRRLQAAGCDRVVVLPLYPQYASSSTGSSLEKVYAEAGRLMVVPRLIAVEDFFDSPHFLDPQAALAKPVLEDLDADHVLFSFHGLPERQVKATDLGDHCFTAESCCAAMNSANRACYRAQCFATARGLAARLGLEDGAWSVSFQSRLGRTPWIKPYTDEHIPTLVEQGVKRLAVLCPSFVADCLETLEEIGMRAKEDFTSAGGEALALVPCVNSDPAWVAGVEGLAREALAAAGGEARSAG